MKALPKYILLAVLFSTIESFYLSGQDKDSIVLDITLTDAYVFGSRSTSPIRVTPTGSLILSFNKIEKLPKLFGYADPLRYIQMLPGVQTNAELQGGIHIQGCDNSHNDINIKGVPIYNPVHLFGFFSTFNATHYGSLELNKSSKAAFSSNRLGGELNLSSPVLIHDSTDFEFTVGLLSSEGTGRFRISSKTCLTASARISYLNLLYRRWLTFDDMDAKYSFYDANFSLIHRIDDASFICADYYGGMDKGGFISNSFNSDINVLWGNQMASFRYIHDRQLDFSLENNTYFTTYSNNISLVSQDKQLSLPSSIMDFGNKTKVKWKGITGGVDVVYHIIHPQNVENDSQSQVMATANYNTNTIESSLYVDWKFPFKDFFFMDTGLRCSVYGSRKTGCFWGLDPSFTIGYDNQKFRINAHYFLRHQYLFQTGFTDFGLPTEFWISSDKVFKPQYAHSLSFNFSCFFHDYMFRVDGDVFYKRLYNQIEYVGSVYDLAGKAYDLYDNLHQGSGKNYGFSFSLNKCSGVFTGWLSYTYTKATRTYSSPDISGTFPANHERPHQLNAVLTYSLGSHWDFGMTFVYASGTPFTAPRSLYLINSSIIMSYGEHNANRLTPYYRLDFSMNYKWRIRHQHENGINFSVYNLTCHKNDLFYTVSLQGDAKVQYHPVTFFSTMLPSISYYFKF